jgi:glycosyltransferase involved in cell wall biosynthesis
VLEYPLVTIVALCFNQQRFVLETLDSIREQTYPNIQVIIVDDFSSDASVEIIQNWLTEYHLNWIFIRHCRNEGISKSLNEALEIASGKYFKAIACDDLLGPECIRELSAILCKSEESIAMIYGDVSFIDENSKLTGLSSFTSNDWKYGYSNPPSGMIFDLLAEVCFIPAPSVLLKTQILKEFKFDESLFFEDWDLWLRIAKKYQIISTTLQLVKYRVHSKSMYQIKSPDFRDSELRVAEMHLGFSHTADIVFRQFIYEKSIIDYMEGGKRSLYWLWKRFLLKRTIKNFLHVIFALIGISYQQKIRWIKN